jgi:hypothetical protein
VRATSVRVMVAVVVVVVVVVMVAVVVVVMVVVVVVVVMMIGIQSHLKYTRDAFDGKLYTRIRGVTAGQAQQHNVALVQTYLKARLRVAHQRGRPTVLTEVLKENRE